MVVARSLLGVIAALALTWPVIAGPDWLETLDAGSMVITAQDTTSAGVVRSITGSLSPSDQEDLFIIQVDEAVTFSAQTQVRGGTTDFDTQLWLFDEFGFGLLGNDNDPGGGLGSLIRTPSDDGVTLELPGPGRYILGISPTGNEPRSQNGLFSIFDFASPTEISGPDGLGGGGFIDSWSASTGLGGQYFVAISPAPSTMIPLVALVAYRTRRRRR